MKSLLKITVLLCGIAFSACSTPNAAPADEGQNMTYAEIKAEYDAKQEAPYTRVQYVYADQVGSMTPYRVVEVKVNGVWTVDTTATEGGITESAMAYLANMVAIPNYENTPSGTTVTFKKLSGNQYKVVSTGVQHNTTMEQEVVFDQYFCIIKATQKADGQEVIKIYDVTWSTVQ